MPVRGERERVEAARQDLSKLWIFAIRDRGSLTAGDGLKSRAMQYEVGNPLTAERVTLYRPAVGLDAPRTANSPDLMVGATGIEPVTPPV
jgi:hypothetical protein